MSGPTPGDRARYTFGDAGPVVGRVVRVTRCAVEVRWSDRSSTLVRPAGFVPASDADTEWEIVR